ncbi:MAG: Pycsar system effector family protein, partial [Gammaproteobacteria bacterium]
MADHDHRCGTHDHPDGAAAGRLITTDPVCGMTVKLDTAFRMAYAGTTYLFCGDDCLERFQSAPERYLEAAAPAIKNPQPASSRGTPGRKVISAPHPGSVTEPGQRIGTMSNAEALRLAVQILDNLHAQIRATDEKIRALFAGSAIFVAALTLTGQQTLSQLKSEEQGTLIPLIAYTVLLATLAFSLISAVLALRPRLSHHEIAERSLFYFGDIHRMETADYVRAFMGLSGQAALDQVLTQVHVNAKIVQKKYLWT